MKSKSYVNKMNEIHASEDLIQKTINSVNDMNKRKKAMKVKKILAGAACLVLVSAGSVGAYVAISGNTEILEKIGIKLSQNYEQNEQAISENNSYQSAISVDGVDAKLKSVAIDNDSLVMEIDLNLDDTLICDKPNLKVKSINVYRASNQSNIGEDLVITEKNSVQKMEDGTYKLFKYLAISDPAVTTNNFWYDIFYEDETVKCSVTFDGLVDEDGNDIVKAEEQSNEWIFSFELNKPTNLSEIDSMIERKESFNFKDV